MNRKILKEPLFRAVGINCRLQIISKPCYKKRCCHSGFVVPFISHRQNSFGIILKGPGVFRMANEHWLQFQVISCIIVPNNRVSLSFEPLKSDTDLSSLSIKVLDGIFFQ